MPDYCGECHAELDTFCEECQGFYCADCEGGCGYCAFWDPQESENAQDGPEEPVERAGDR